MGSNESNLSHQAHHKVHRMSTGSLPSEEPQKVSQGSSQTTLQETPHDIRQNASKKTNHEISHKETPVASQTVPQKIIPNSEAIPVTGTTMMSAKTEMTKAIKDINILLLGETGVGKSTFINSIFNYLQYRDFNTAEHKKLNVLIPAIFSTFDKDDNLRTIRIGADRDENECREIGESATQSVRTYIFQIRNGQYRVRLIDTPGMGDTRGIEQDDLNCENILNYIGNLQELHAICYLCKSQQTRATSYFQYCMAQIMTRLHADACKNFVFIFTGCKAENYTPGETFKVLQKVADEISRKSTHAKLKFDDNIFCFDNEAFRYLAAIKQGVNLIPKIRSDAIESWRRATVESWRMIDYILKLKPHYVQHTSAINEARRLIYQLSKPMADITQLVQDNIMLLQRHNHNMDLETNSIQELKEKLYIPSIKLEVTKLDKPVTVCADIKCCELYKVDERNEYHYKTRCHDPCIELNTQREVIGAPELKNCSAMNEQQLCSRCGCSYRVHMHVYYYTKKITVDKPDPVVLQNINDREHAVQRLKVLVNNLEERKLQYERELDIITKANAKFAHFLEKNAIATFTDAYAEYIQYLIVREKSRGKDCNIANVTALDTLLRQHNEQKKIFDAAAQRQEKLGGEGLVTPQNISQTMYQLFGLPLSGKDIKAMYFSQKTAREKEHTNTEYTHNVTFNKTTKKQEATRPTASSASCSKGRRRHQSEGRRVRNTSPPPPYDASPSQARTPRQPPADHRTSHSPHYSSHLAVSHNPPPGDSYQARYYQLLQYSAEIMQTMANNLGHPSDINNGCPQNASISSRPHPPYPGQSNYDQHNQSHGGIGPEGRNYPVYDRERYVWTKKS
ncbi:uncharacterized protein LOC143200248 [Rhynchophorus ferrugineus]|uniref:uncharacterized protein LOC143200248 n=1 Tax=Rhynchophorus ferrugineus TaxID=354439 RepID=UPI003FCD7F99